MPPIRIACIQSGCATEDKLANLKHNSDLVREASRNGAKFVILPEYAITREFNKRLVEQDVEEFGIAPNGDFSSFDASQSKSQIIRQLSSLANENKIYLFAGSYAELDTKDGKIYNTMPVFGPDGRLLTTYRKVHLCDLPYMASLESSIVQPGQKLQTVKTEYGSVGLAICYDLRFSEQAAAMAKAGVFLIVYPALFPTRTGSLHWDILQRARALDNQVFVATTGRAADSTIPWDPYGRSAVTDPLGRTLAQLGGEEGILYAEVDPDAIFSAQQQLGVRSGARHDLYKQGIVC